MDYPRNSTHLNEWLFSKDVLKKKRMDVYTEAESSFYKKIQECGGDIHRLTFPTYDDIIHLIQYFTGQLIFVCTEKHLDYKVASTAVCFFTRFYLCKSPLNYDPRRILLTCILLAVKVEECRSCCSIQHFCDGLISSKARLKEVVESEVIVLEALSFSIRVLHPRASIHHHTTEYYQTYKPSNDDASYAQFNQKIIQLNNEAEKLALQVCEDNEIPFLFSPSYIGTACFLYLSKLDDYFSNAETFFEMMVKKTHETYSLSIDVLRPVLLDLQSRITCFLVHKKNELVDESAKAAFKTIKQIERLVKMLNKSVLKAAASTSIQPQIIKVPNNIILDNVETPKEKSIEDQKEDVVTTQTFVSDEQKRNCSPNIKRCRVDTGKEYFFVLNGYVKTKVTYWKIFIETLEQTKNLDLFFERLKKHMY